MQRKGLVILFSLILAVICFFSLSNTWYANKVEKNALLLSDGSETSQKLKLDSLAQSDTLNLGFTKYTYDDSKKKALNLGLDLKGGLNMTLQVSVKDLLINLSGESQNPSFLQALAAADAKQSSSNQSYIDAFFESFYQQTKSSNIKLSSSDIFGNSGLSQQITANSTNQEVEKVVREKVEASLDKAYQIIRARIDRFGVAQPNVQRVENSGRILVELPGIKDVNRAKNLLQSTAKLEFWEAFRLYDPKTGAPTEAGLLAENIKTLDAKGQSVALSKYLTNDRGTYVASINDTAMVNKILSSPSVRASFPATLKYAKLLWGAKEDKVSKTLPLYVINGSRTGKPLLDGDVVTSASYDRDMNTIGGGLYISMSMNADGTQRWSDITNQFKASSENANDGKLVAVVLDDLVYTAPQINQRITGGQSQISGDFTLDEAKDITNILNAGSLPAKTNIIQSEIVGPSLGKEAIQSGMISFAIAFLLVIGWMILYYGRAGFYADLALIFNLFLIFGILASLKSVLTLPGIAGIVLTMGMAVDANVILYERVKECLAKGMQLKAAVAEAYSMNGGLSSIVDANVTTLITAVVLFVFGEGPIKGFATTLIVGIFTSVFTAIYVSRLFIDGRIEKGKDVSFFNGFSKNWFTGYNFDFLGKRKLAYAFSSVLVLVSLISLATRGMDFGIDFVGGRNYTVRFDKPVDPRLYEKQLAEVFVDNQGNKFTPLVKTFGTANQVKVTTKYKIENDDPAVETEIVDKIYKASKNLLPSGTTLANFATASKGKTIGIMSSEKVGPTIADDIKSGAVIAILISLSLVFVYILLRFKTAQFSMGAVVAVVHDAIITMGVFSILKGLVPFSLEVDQAFIAAILTVIGYSLNDTVIVFDRIREFLGFQTENIKKSQVEKVINASINTTMARTINTSFTTLFVIFAIFFFGGESIKGFMFALLVGIGIGTYSSVFIATPLMYDFSKEEDLSGDKKNK
ncbi:MAG: protein translocase subunit SecDF [Flavobacteriaceae bacterium]|nr:MAG: protein translocase subunit SecDF [Flavobacteriaceae bacterium]